MDYEYLTKKRNEIGALSLDADTMVTYDLEEECQSATGLGKVQK
jgi:hypothetical protein